MNKRKKDLARAYLRRSSEKQEASLDAQLKWAKNTAPKHDVTLNATQLELEQMMGKGLNFYNDVYIDDSESGSDMSRPGLLKMVEDVISNPRISHVFIFRRDRFARPEEPLEATLLEQSLTMAGVTIVFSDSVAGPSPQGPEKLFQTLVSLFQYYQSGEFLDQLADRVIRGHLLNACKGHWTGGSAPYGFIRVLVNASGVVKEKLPPRKHVHLEGCHIEIRPHDLQKIAIWLRILDLKSSGMGYQRIAKVLNEENIPSPNAGGTRKYRGITCSVSSTWSRNTIRSLCKNAAIVGWLEYGKRSTGKHRRLGEEGPRVLADSDRVDGKRRKVINNPASIRSKGKMGFENQYDIEKWHELQRDMEEHGKNQRGVSKGGDPSKYPLSCRVYDLTEECGWTMTGATVSNRKIYQCGRYQKSHGMECYHNVVDADGLLSHLVADLRRKLVIPGGREPTRELLLRKVQHGLDNLPNPPDQRSILSDSIAHYESQINKLTRRMAADADDDELYTRLKAEYKRLVNERIDKQRQLDNLQESSLPEPRQIDPMQEVENALNMIEEIKNVLEAPIVAARVQKVISSLGIRIGVNFGKTLKGQREVRQLLGGMITSDNHPLSVPTFGKNNLEGKELVLSAPTKSDSLNAPIKGDDENLSLSKTKSNQRKGISLTKVHHAGA